MESFRWSNRNGDLRVDGGRFLPAQRVQLEQYGEQITELEVIGKLCPFGEEPSEHVHSRFYDSQGNTLDYVPVVAATSRQ